MTWLYTFAVIAMVERPKFSDTHLHRHPSCKSHRCSGVPEIMQMDAWQLGFIGKGMEPFAHPFRLESGTVSSGEHQVVIG